MTGLAPLQTALPVSSRRAKWLRGIWPGDIAVRLVILIWVFGYVSFDVLAWLGGRSTLLSNLVISVPYIITGILLSLALDRLRQKIVLLPHWVAMPLLLFAIVLVAGIQMLIDRYVALAFSFTLFPEWRRFTSNIHVLNYVISILFYFWQFAFCMAILTALRAGFSAERAAARAAQLEAASLQAEIATLRLQLNPHFLFNSLNSIASAVATRRDEAEDMICYLADFLRSSIATDPSVQVNLSDEIATIESYLTMERLRFEDRLEVRFSVDPATANAKVPSFLLQPLVENAVKHGVSTTPLPGFIEIIAKRQGTALVLIVRNGTKIADGEVLAISSTPRSAARSLGVGLENTRQRLALIYGEAAEFTVGHQKDVFQARISLPWQRVSRA